MMQSMCPTIGEQILSFPGLHLGKPKFMRIAVVIINRLVIGQDRDTSVRDNLSYRVSKSRRFMVTVRIFRDASFRENYIIQGIIVLT